MRMVTYLPEPASQAEEALGLLASWSASVGERASDADSAAVESDEGPMRR
jgi:hypothetical protein